MTLDVMWLVVSMLAWLRERVLADVADRVVAPFDVTADLWSLSEVAAAEDLRGKPAA